MKARCQTDRPLFGKFFFGEKIPTRYSRFHLDTLESPKVAFRERPPMTGWRRAMMVPRGNGKTTVAIRIEVCHDTVYKFEEYIVVLAESAGLAVSRVREVAVELEQNKLLKEYFGDLRGGDIWRRGKGEIETSNGVAIYARSRRGQVRGLLHTVTNARPTKVIADDFENSDEVLNPELRAKDARFWREDVEGGGTTDGRTCFQMTGTPLHREALLPGLAQNPAWDFRSYPAITSWPKRMDLWERCRSIFSSAGIKETNEKGLPVVGPGAVSLAHDFYKANRKRMDLGCEILWPEGEPLFALMVFRWANGEASFSKEKMLVPRDPELATFEMNAEDYPLHGALRHRISGQKLIVDTRDGKTRELWLRSLRFVSFHDPSGSDPKRKKKRARGNVGDFASITTIGFEKLDGGGQVGHVVNAWMERQPTSVQIAAHFDLWNIWGHDLCILESDTFGLLKKSYRDEAAQRRLDGRPWQMPIKSLDRQTVNKDARIAAMEPSIVNGWLTFNEELPLRYWNQWVDHPTGDHDDGPDSAEGAWRGGTRKRAGLRNVVLT